MLSRVAARLYWSARYLERAEDLARVVNAYSQFIFDIPKDPRFGWENLIAIVDCQELYHSRYKKVTEANVMKFMFLAPENPGSLKSSVKFARENIRTTRDALPEEVWELVNELHLFVGKGVTDAVRRAARYEFLENVVSRNLEISGLYDGSMVRDRSLEFVRLGRYVERCDMTTRVLDVGTLTPDGSDIEDDEALVGREVSLWANLLDSLSATSAYRRRVGPVVEPDEVMKFLFHDDKFPRSVRYCLSRAQRVLGNFPNNQKATQILDKLLKRLDRFKVENRSREQIHQFIDHIQYELIQLNTTIDETWFNPE